LRLCEKERGALCGSPPLAHLDLRFSFIYRQFPESRHIYVRTPRMDTAQLSLLRQPFGHPDLLFELKHDGFRSLALWDGKCELVSRRHNTNKSFQELRGNLAKLKVGNAAVGGELVCLDSEAEVSLMSYFSDESARFLMLLICSI
jgi:hypothetical protein